MICCSSGAKRRRTAKQKAADDLAAAQEKADYQTKMAQVQKLAKDLQQAQDEARDNLEASMVLATLCEKGVVSIDDNFKVTLSQTGEALNNQ